MGLWKVLPILVLCIHSTLAVWTLKWMATKYIPSDYINNGVGEHKYDQGAANSVAFDPASSFAYVAGNKFIQVVDYSRFARPNIVRRQKTTAPAADIARCGFLVAWITRGVKITDPGTVHVWDMYRRVSKKWNLLCDAKVGADPVSLKFFHNCETIVIANKGTPAADAATNTFTDPEGTISIVRIVKAQQQQQQGGQPNYPGQGAGAGTRFATTQGNCAAQFGHRMTVTTIDFRRFNTMTNRPFLNGVRMPYDGSMDGSRPTLSKALEPTYVTGDPTYNDTAYVSLRANNAVVQLILTPGNEAITGFNPMGMKTWFNNDLDASSTPRGISFNKYNMYSMRQPNAIESFEIRNQYNLASYLFTADEGATTSYRSGSKSFTDAVPFSRLQNLPNYISRNHTGPGQLGNLEVSRVDGLRNPQNPNSGYDYVSFFGGRGISMFKFNDTSSNLDLVWDSGDQVARGVAETYPQVFNSKSTTADAQSHGPKSQRDLASTERGAQCKSLAVAKVDRDTTLVFVGADGPSVIGIFSVSQNGSYPAYESVYRKAPMDGEFSILMDNKNMGDIDPAKLIFVPRSATPDNYNYLMVMGKKSGTLSMYRIFRESRRNMLNRLRKEALSSASALNRSVPVILLSFVFAAFTRFL
ncbi:mesenchyme-specific cell surface glycoprotein-like [Strongylocentrotus purpuratus]|uniref:Choice-of-anchor I domain-containing protein n=1 Tax=Strongylocentrotus purpuratus TaxID=7668 RepID=A0A7M7SX13_STRPU|nr:mesenchyme-specific cell surface glycoprotein-like [Strongylocentrotus purpuratus]